MLQSARSGLQATGGSKCKGIFMSRDIALFTFDGILDAKNKKKLFDANNCLDIRIFMSY